MKLFLLLCLTGVCLAYEDKTLYQYFVDNGYTMFVSAIQTAGLHHLFDSNGPYTVFAPTDAAFAKAGLVSLAFFTHEQIVVTVEYTMVKEFVLIPMVGQLTAKNTVTNQSLFIEPFMMTLRLNNVSAVNSSYNDIIVNNGVVQPVDTLLTPPIWPTRPPPTTPQPTAAPPTNTIYQLIIRDDTRFSDLALALLLADVYQLLETGEYTFFAPTDAAFAPFKDNLLDPNDPDYIRIYQEVMKYHMVHGRRLSSNLANGSQLYTLHGTALSVSIGTDIMVNNAKVIDQDIMATNGVIHVIDHLLIPQDINQIAQG